MYKKFNDSNKDYWITSDPHYWHKNIVRGISNWSDKSGCRDFDKMSQHNNTIVNHMNRLVKPDDVLICLGDWSFSGIDKIWEFRKKLNVKEIHLLLGNHDHHIENDKYIEVNGEEELAKKIAGRIGTDQNDYFVSTQDLFTSVNHVALFQIHGLRLFCSHYAHRVWNKSHKGRVHLYGHSHGTLPDFGRSMDVGIDAAYKRFGEYRPFKFQEIQRIMQNKEVEFVDHHNENTN